MDQASWAERIRAEMEREWQRAEPPEGAPALPPIPTGRYLDATFEELERDRLWKRSWLLVAREEDLDQPGSFVTTDRTGSPLLLVRGHDGVLRGFYNTCQHRGAPVVREACGAAKRLRCQYHSWTYDLDGTLLHVPDRRDFAGLDLSQRALVPVRCESFGGWVFVNEDPEAEPLERTLGAVAREWSVLGGESLRRIATRGHRVPANWKIVMDAFLEVYHLRTVHPSTVSKLLDHRGAAMGLFAGGHSRMVTPKFPEALRERRETRTMLREIPGLDPLYAETNVAYNIFPNLIVPLDTTGFPIIELWPHGVAETQVDWTFYAPPAETPEQEAVWKLVLEAFDQVMEEDFRNLAPMHRSVASGALASIPLSWTERRIYHVHEQIDRTIGPDRVPPELRIPPKLEPLWE